MESSNQGIGLIENLDWWGIERTGGAVLTLSHRLKEADRWGQIFGGNLAVLSSIYLTTTLRSVKDLENGVYQLIEAFQYLQSFNQMYPAELNSSIPIGANGASPILDDVLRQLNELNPTLRELIEALKQNYSLPGEGPTDTGGKSGLENAYGYAKEFVFMVNFLNTLGKILGFTGGELGIVLTRLMGKALAPALLPGILAGGMMYGTLALGQKLQKYDPSYQEIKALDEYSGYERIEKIQEQNSDQIDQKQYQEITDFVRSISADKRYHTQETMQEFVNNLASEMEINIAQGKDYLIEHGSNGTLTDTLVEKFIQFREEKNMERFKQYQSQNPIIKNLTDYRSLEQQINLHQNLQQSIITKPSFSVEVNIDGKNIPSSATIIDSREISEWVSNFDEIDSIRYGKEAIRMG
ncbi:hypothetical protein [Alkaliphilus crotonatoxidans]